MTIQACDCVDSVDMLANCRSASLGFGACLVAIEARVKVGEQQMMFPAAGERDEDMHCLEWLSPELPSAGH